jgi:hypothetical protein
MSKRIHLFILAIVIIVYADVLQAQAPGSAFSLYGGVAITAGNFAKEGGTTFPAWINAILGSAPLQSPGFPSSGCARAGFMAGAQFTTGGGIGWIINATYAQNRVSHNPPWRIPIPSSSDYATISIETGSWNSACILTGLKIGTAYPRGPNAFIAPLIGVMVIESPTITGTIAKTGTTQTEKLESASGTALTYGIAGEFTLWGHLLWGIRYIYSTPHFDIPYTTTYGANSEDGTIAHQQSTSLILSYIGYSF